MSSSQNTIGNVRLGLRNQKLVTPLTSSCFWLVGYNMILSGPLLTTLHLCSLLKDKMRSCDRQKFTHSHQFKEVRVAHSV